MTRLLVPLFSILFLAACNNNPAGGDAESDTAADTAAGNPARVHPPEETITDSTKLVNDSVIVPDTAPKSGTEVIGDTTRR